MDGIQWKNKKKRKKVERGRKKSSFSRDLRSVHISSRCDQTSHHSIIIFIMISTYLKSHVSQSLCWFSYLLLSLFPPPFLFTKSEHFSSKMRIDFLKWEIIWIEDHSIRPRTWHHTKNSMLAFCVYAENWNKISFYLFQKFCYFSIVLKWPLLCRHANT